ncbi:MAG: hypothetical protein RXO71_02260 [Nitrososphaeria archaeon]|jgi:myo-inositol-1-phosphate synthase|nr:hypothetical protein [Nitrososphaerota archaeon]
MHSKIRIALIGVGNVAEYVIKGIYGNVKPWHQSIGRYNVSDIEVVGAFDVDERKVGKSLRELYKTGPEVLIKPSVFFAEELSREMVTNVKLVKTDETTFKNEIKKIGADQVISLINSGQQMASELIAKISAETGSSFINATPALIVQKERILSEFINRKLLVAGDDLQSQLGGTWLHRILMLAFKQFGSTWVKSYQLDVGGSFETLNTMDERIREHKKKIKSSAIKREDEASEVITGTTDYVPFLQDYRISHFYVEVLGPFNEKFYIDAEYKTRDGPNAFNIIVDVVRALKYEKDKGSYGTINLINSFGFKSNAGGTNLLKILEDFEKNYLI